MAESGVLRSRFAARVRALLGEAGLSGEELAARSELPAKRIEKILAGRLLRITLTDMAMIAGVLGTPLYDLLAPVETQASLAALEIVEKG